MNIHSPKFGPATRPSARYYAGFSEAFVESVLLKNSVLPSETVLDCWNGSGTTTTICSRSGINSIGIDINPLMAHLARTRSTDQRLRNKHLREISHSLQGCIFEHIELTPFQHAIRLHQVLASNYGSKAILNECVVVLCNAIRRSYGPIRQRNPTWHKNKVLWELKISSSVFLSAVLECIDSELKIINENKHKYITPPRIYTADWINTKRLLTNIDHIVSSPPYLTRIDYTQSMLHYMLYMSSVYKFDIRKLRRKMMGSVLTVRSFSSSYKSNIAEIDDLLAGIRAHDSKASSTYYASFYAKYFYDLIKSLEKISTSLRGGGTMTLVTQGSWYKDIFIDLPALVSIIAQRFDLIPQWEAQFLPRNHMAHINSRSHASTQSAPYETVTSYVLDRR